MDKGKIRRLLVVLLSLVMVMTVFASLVGAEGETVEPTGSKDPQPNHDVTAVDDPDPSDPNDTRVFIVKAGESITISVLDNDIVTQSNHNSLRVQAIVTRATNGTAVIDSGGRTITYTAYPDCEATSDQFEYKAGVGQSSHNTSTARVYIVIEPKTQPPANNAPIALPFATTTQAGQLVSINIISDIHCSDPDGDPVTVQSLGAPGSGSVSHDGAQTITYTSFAGFYGTDSFTYTISDSNGATASATITIAVNQPPLPKYKPLKPILESVTYYGKVNSGEHAWEAHWGWLNENDFEVEALVCKFTGSVIGNDNSPVTFAAGRQRDMFSTIFTSANLVWTLMGPDGSQRTATAGRAPIPDPEPPTTGHLTVRKQLEGGDNDAEFRISVTRRDNSPTLFGSQELIYISVNRPWEKDLEPGTYQVTEDDMPEGYFKEDISHEDGWITIEAGKEYIVTIVNRYEPETEPETGTLVIRKQITGSGYNPDARFSVTIEPYGEVTPRGSQEVRTASISVNAPWHKDLEPGTYLIREVEQPSSRYKLVGISNEGIVEVVAGETSEVIVTNKYRAPEPPLPPDPDPEPDPEPEPEPPQKPEEPTPPEEPTEPAVEPEEPSEPEEPIEPEKPVEPTEPEQPTQPDPGTLPKTGSVDAALVLGSILTIGGLWLGKKQR